MAQITDTTEVTQERGEPTFTLRLPDTFLTHCERVRHRPGFTPSYPCATQGPLLCRHEVGFGEVRGLLGRGLSLLLLSDCQN